MNHIRIIPLIYFKAVSSWADPRPPHASNADIARYALLEVVSPKVLWLRVARSAAIANKIHAVTARDWNCLAHTGGASLARRPRSRKTNLCHRNGSAQVGRVPNAVARRRAAQAISPAVRLVATANARVAIQIQIYQPIRLRF